MSPRVAFTALVKHSLQKALRTISKPAVSLTTVLEERKKGVKQYTYEGSQDQAQGGREEVS